MARDDIEINRDNSENPITTSPKKYWKIAIFIIIVIVIVVLIIMFGGMLRNNEPDWTTVKAENGEIRINSTEVDDGKLHYFKLKNSEYGFFILKNPSGQFVTRMSICEPCNGIKFSLKDSGETLECNTCGTLWDTTNFKGISGGCVNSPPPELEHYEDSGFIVIQEADL
jgi:uncharacterized membrane protein